MSNAHLEPEHYMSSGSKAKSSQEELQYEVGVGLEQFVDKLLHSFSEKGGISYQEESVSQALQIYVSLTTLRAVSSPFRENPSLLLSAFCDAIENHVPLTLLFLCCPDVDYKEGTLHTLPSANRLIEMQQILKAGQLLKQGGISPHIEIIIGDDWFHPLVRQRESDPQSIDRSILSHYLEGLQQFFVRNGSSLYTKVELLTTLDGFDAYYASYLKWKCTFSGSPMSEYVQKHVQRSEKQTSVYYQSLLPSQREEVVKDDLALYTATYSFFSQKIKRTGNQGIVISFEPDRASLERFTAHHEERGIGIANFNFPK